MRQNGGAFRQCRNGAYWMAKLVKTVNELIILLWHESCYNDINGIFIASKACKVGILN